MAKEKHFMITWPELGISVECKPAPFNRASYDWYMDHLPLKGIVGHVAVSGDVAAARLKLSEDLPVLSPGELKTMPMTEVPVGCGGFRCPVKGATGLGTTHGRRGGLGIYYGLCTEDMTGGYNFQVVDEDIEKLKKAGAAIKNAIYKTKQILTIELSVKK